MAIFKIGFIRTSMIVETAEVAINADTVEQAADKARLLYDGAFSDDDLAFRFKNQDLESCETRLITWDDKGEARDLNPAIDDVEAERLQQDPKAYDAFVASVLATEDESKAYDAYVASQLGPDRAGLCQLVGEISNRQWRAEGS